MLVELYASRAVTELPLLTFTERALLKYPESGVGVTKMVQAAYWDTGIKVITREKYSQQWEINRKNYQSEWQKNQFHGLFFTFVIYFF